VQKKIKDKTKCGSNDKVMAKDIGTKSKKGKYDVHLLLLDYLIYDSMQNLICHLLKRKQFVTGKTHYVISQVQPATLVESLEMIIKFSNDIIKEEGLEIPARLMWMDGLKGVDSVEESKKTNLD